MELGYGRMTNRADAMSLVNGTAVTVLVFNMRTDMFVGIEQIDDTSAPLRHLLLPHEPFLRASIFRYGTGHSRGTRSFTFHPEMSAEYVTIPTTVGMTAGRRILNKDARVLWPEGSQLLEPIRQPHVYSDVHRL